MVKKYSNRLTARDVLDAFQEEAKEMVRREHIKNIAELAPYQSAMIDISQSDHDDNTKMFLLKLWAFHVPEQVTDNIKRLGLLRRLMLNKNDVILAEDVKHVPIESLHAFGKVRRSARGITALCPFHDEDTPSFHIFTKDNHYRCFGCGANGDVIDFVQRLHGLNFKDAINFLAR